MKNTSAEKFPNRVEKIVKVIAVYERLNLSAVEEEEIISEMEGNDERMNLSAVKVVASEIESSKTSD
ncbi:hypothetical protein U1Q18_039384 [Sarracenia purpurea var. burkii]